MKINFLLLVSYFLSPLAYGQQGQARREIPASWIAKLQKYDYKTSANELVREFQTYIAPDSLTKFREEAFLSPMFVNLDEDKEFEILLFIGGENSFGFYEPKFCVLKCINEKWLMLHNEYMYYHNQMPEMGIINQQTSNKLFYVQKLHGYGTGMFETRLHFYKLIDGVVYNCFEAVNEYKVSMVGIEELLKTTLSYGMDGSLFVKYQYSYSLEKATIVDVKEEFRYLWDKQSKFYKAVFYPKDKINEDKIGYFLDHRKNAKKMLAVFKQELDELAINGTEQQKKALHIFLNPPKRNKKD